MIVHMGNRDAKQYLRAHIGLYFPILLLCYVHLAYFARDEYYVVKNKHALEIESIRQLEGEYALYVFRNSSWFVVSPRVQEAINDTITVYHLYYPLLGKRTYSFCTNGYTLVLTAVCIVLAYSTYWILALAYYIRLSCKPNKYVIH